MTVPVSQRGENKMDVFVKAERLVQHTLHITSNTNVFDVRYGYLTALVCDHAVSAYRHMWMANNIVVRTKSDLERRREYQDIAADELNGMMAEIELCRGVFNLKPRKGAHWVRITSVVRGLLRKWQESDHKRFKDVQ
jgi:hypothetical protein